MKNVKNVNKKLDLYMTVSIGYFLAICISFAYLELGNNIENYIMITILMITAIVSYYLNKTIALIMSMVIDFLFCTYKFLITLNSGVVLDSNLAYWLILIPITAVLISKLSELILKSQEKINVLEAQNKELIMIDDLTGLRNYSALINELPIYMNLHRRHNLQITLVLVRIKHSRRLTKIIGNEFFYEVQKKCSEVLTQSLRFEDRKYLIDKKTFAYILITDLKGATIVKNRMKEAIKQISIGKEVLYKDLNIEVQIGAYEQTKDIKDSMEFLTLAEKELDYDV